MFRALKRSGEAPTTRQEPRLLLKRALLFAGGLALLWLATQLMPSPSASTPLYSDESGTVAANPGAAIPERQRAPSLVGPGYLVALLLLGGGGAFAVLLRRRTSSGRATAAEIQSLGAMQIAPAQQLRLVACGDEVLLLGVTSSQITLLKSYPRESFNDANASPSPDPPMPGSLSSPVEPVRASFAGLLRDYAGVHSNGNQKVV